MKIINSDATPPYAALAEALHPITSRVRTDITAVKRADGRQAWTKEPLTPERMARHLNGGPARGVCPIKAGESVTMVALLDFDSHGGETPWESMAYIAGQVVDTLMLLGAAPIAFRSSGGRGAHVYCLWDEPQDAYSVRKFMQGALEACALRSGTKGVAQGEVEVFPKQNSVPLDGNGSQFILPLAGASVPLEYCDMAGSLFDAPRGRDAVLTMAMRTSVPVEVLTAPVRVPQALGDVAEVSADFLSALAVLNADEDLSYEDWRNVIFAVHHETGGSAQGLALAHDISSRSMRYDPAFLDERVWPYIHSGGTDRAGVVTGRTVMALARARGWCEGGGGDAFNPIPEGLPPGACGEVLADVVRRGIPTAHFLTTDQANANRLVDSFGARVFVAAGRWYSWTGRHWAHDEADVYRYACRLSDLIRAEAATVRARAAGAQGGLGALDLKGGEKAEKLAEALDAWARKSEMKATIEAAVGLVRKMLDIDPEALDRDPWALNCLNGTIDLKTGVLRPHAASDYITKLINIEYDPEAEAPLWNRTLAQITLEDKNEGDRRPVADFLERWFGYCATGLTTEQKFLVHWGAGANGKSTVLDTVAEILGSYAGTAAPGLLMTSKSDKHPTEIAGLFGLRMVTAHESGDGAALREDMIKQATGGDKLVARRMREDFFEFTPTHKLQLLTNHKPTVKGQDHGIWRRVLLVPYLAKFGARAQVEEGSATHEANIDLVGQLRGERAGILARIVRGAGQWATTGLEPPAAVLAASEAYRSEQDRVRQFVGEVCEMGMEFSEPLAFGMSGLYPSYVSWCKDGGVYPMSRRKFVDEILRAVPNSRSREETAKGEGAKRRTVVKIYGLRVLQE